MLVAVVKKCHGQQISIILIIFVFKCLKNLYFSAKSSGMIEIFMYFAMGICCGSSFIKFLSSLISESFHLYKFHWLLLPLYRQK